MLEFHRQQPNGNVSTMATSRMRIGSRDGTLTPDIDGSAVARYGWKTAAIFYRPHVLFTRLIQHLIPQPLFRL